LLSVPNNEDEIAILQLAAEVVKYTISKERIVEIFVFKKEERRMEKFEYMLQASKE